MFLKRVGVVRLILRGNIFWLKFFRENISSDHTNEAKQNETGKYNDFCFSVSFFHISNMVTENRRKIKSSFLGC